MCDLRFSAIDVRDHCGASAETILEEAEQLLARDENSDLLRRTADGFVVTEQGRPFLRSICAHFDGYLAGSNALHSASV
jgi:oxygen-independent coproporphyrinogen-3 oxidase